MAGYGGRTFKKVIKVRWCNIRVQSLSCVWLFATPRTAAHQASLSITNSQSLPKPMTIELVMPSNHLMYRRWGKILCCPLLLPPSIFPSIKVVSNESVLCIKWPKYWSFSFSISPSKEYSGQISFRMDWFDLLAVQGTLKSLLYVTLDERHVYGTLRMGHRIWRYKCIKWMLTNVQHCSCEF